MINTGRFNASNPPAWVSAHCKPTCRHRHPCLVGSTMHARGWPSPRGGLVGQGDDMGEGQRAADSGALIHRAPGRCDVRLKINLPRASQMVSPRLGMSCCLEPVPD